MGTGLFERLCVGYALPTLTAAQSQQCRPEAGGTKDMAPIDAAGGVACVRRLHIRARLKPCPDAAKCESGVAPTALLRQFFLCSQPCRAGLASAAPTALSYLSYFSKEKTS